MGSAATGAPSSGHVAVRLEASSLHPVDVAVARGLMAGLGGAGSEGVGVVEALGSGVAGLRAGDRVLVHGAGVGAWSQRALVPAANVCTLRKGLTAEQGASLTPVCAALRMLADAGHGLKAGDVVLHVGAPGAVGMAVAQLGAARGLRVVTIIGNAPASAEAIATLKEHGSYMAVTDAYARSAAFRKLLADLPVPRLALNGRGGPAATDAARALAQGATLVTYGGAAVQVPASLLVARGLRLEGFSLQRTTGDAAQRLVSEAEALVADGTVKLMQERFGLSQFAAALARHMEPFRLRKVVLNHSQ